MKKLILSGILIYILFSCSDESRKIEVITNYDSEYYEVSNYEKHTLQLVPIETKNQMQKDVNEVFSVYKNVGKKGKKIFKYELYVNEDGRIEKVKVPYLENDSFSDKIIERSKGWIFGKFVKDGIAQKYRFDLSVLTITNREKGKTQTVVLGENPDEINKELFFVAVEQMPSPIGGMEAIQKNIRYPEIAKRAGIQGRVFVKAFIDSLGNVAKAEIIKGIGAGCDEAAMEAVKKVKFTPGIDKGNPVNTQVTVPILFKLQ